MATFNKFDKFCEELAKGTHNFSTATLKIALTNTAPTGSSNGVLTDITEISYTNLSSRTLTGTGVSRSGATTTLTASDLVLTASGSVPTFQYVVIYNDSAASKNLVGYYDHGSAVTLANGETYTIDFTTGFATLS